MSELNSDHQRSHVGLRDARALMAVAARLIAGAILSMMFYQYFALQESGGAFVTSRFWWEIVLNLQLLSVGLMWFSHSDRITARSGKLRFMQMARRFMGVCAVLTPSALAVIAAVQGWFHVGPEPYVFVIVAGLASLHLVGSLLVHYRIERQRTDHSPHYKVWHRALFFLPSAVFFVLALVDELTGGITWFILMPLVLFTQGAMPYVMEILGVRKPENYR